MKKHDTPMLDNLEEGPWPSFISGIKNLRDRHEDNVLYQYMDMVGELSPGFQKSVNNFQHQKNFTH